MINIKQRKWYTVLLFVCIALYGPMSISGSWNHDKYRWQGTVDAINVKDGQIVIYDRLFDVNSAVLIYSADGRTLKTLSDLRTNMRVGCVVDKTFKLKEIRILK